MNKERFDTMLINIVLVLCIMCTGFVIGYFVADIMLEPEQNIIYNQTHTDTVREIHNYNYTRTEYVSSEQLQFVIDYIDKVHIRRNKAPSDICARSPRLHELGDIEGWSMTPRFDHGDIPLATPYSTKDKLVEGDDIVYQYKDEIVLHSVCGLYTDFVSTCSMNLDVRHMINYTDIQYVVCGVKRG